MVLKRQRDKKIVYVCQQCEYFFAQEETLPATENTETVNQATKTQIQDKEVQ